MSNWHKFVEKVRQAQMATGSNIALFLNPRIELLPLAAARFDDPFLPFGKAIINATQDLVCAYVFDLAAYLSIGAAGAIALERTIRYVPVERATILHGPFYGDGFSEMADSTGFAVDAITIVNKQHLTTYLDKPPYAAFLVQKNRLDPGQMPDEGGIYWIDQKQMMLNSETILRLSDNSVLFAGKFDDYPQQTRAALEAMR